MVAYQGGHAKHRGGATPTAAAPLNRRRRATTFGLQQGRIMFGIPGKAAVTMTPAAIGQIARLMAREGSSGLRIGVKKGGCAGMEYTMDYVASINPLDEVVEQDGARVMIAPMAQMFLIGTEIDYEAGLLEAGFKFRNPNVAEACGCGESIKFKDQPAV
jgi:iron-sulfur cluster assembly protein